MEFSGTDVGVVALIVAAIAIVGLIIFSYFDNKHKRQLEAGSEEAKREHIRLMAEKGYEEVVFQVHESFVEDVDDWGPRKNTEREWGKRWAKKGV